MRFGNFLRLLVSLVFIVVGGIAPTTIPTTKATASFRTDRDLGAIVDRHARSHGIPTDFARAVVKVESNWNPRLTGAAGEVGLMQIKHGTARYIGFAGTRDELYEPDTNVRWAMKYLADAWELADGDMCLTVLKYQAGHQATSMTRAASAYCSRVRRHMAAAG